MIKLFESDFDEKESLAAARVVADGWLTSGPEVLDFEREIAARLDTTHSSVIGVSSCTAALHLALIAARVVERGGEVIVPALNFVSDFNVCVAVGATPVFCDVSSTVDWSPSVENIRAVVTDKTSAVIITHFAGIPAKNIREIAEYCADNAITLIEDCAHAFGAQIHGRSCGSFGDFAAFSFYSNKNISTGEGGVLLNNTDMDIRHLRSHGMNASTLDRELGRAYSYDVIEPGLNYRLDEVRAAIGLEQLAKFDTKHETRRRLLSKYLNLLAGTNIETPFATLDRTMLAVDHIFPVLLPAHANRERVIAAMKAQGIQTSIHYPAPWCFTAYKGAASVQALPVTAHICDRELTLPLHTRMHENDVAVVVECLLNATNN